MRGVEAFLMHISKYAEHAICYHLSVYHTGWWVKNGWS